MTFTNSLVHTSFEAAREAALVADHSKPPNPPHPVQALKRRPRKAMAFNTELFFKDNAIEYADLAPRTIGWTSSRFQLVERRPQSGGQEVASQSSSHSQSSSSTSYDAPSLAMALYYSADTSTPPPSTSSAIRALNPSARPFQFIKYRPSKALRANIYAPVYVEGEGYVAAVHGRRIQSKESPVVVVTAPAAPAPTDRRYAFRTRAGGAKAVAEATDAVPAVGDKPLAPAAKSSSKGKSHHKAKPVKATPAANEAPAVSVGAKRKRVQAESTPADEDVEMSVEPSVAEEPEAGDTSRTTRASKRRKVVSDELMPPPATIPSRPKRGESMDKEHSEEPAPAPQRNTRSHKKKKPEATSTPMVAAESTEGSEKAAPIKTRAKAADAKKASTSPVPEKEKRSHHKKPIPPVTPSNDDARKSTSPSVSTAPTHSYSTRRAGAMTRTSSNTTAPDSAGKERTSPSGSDQTLVDRSAPSSQAMSDVPSKLEAPPTRVAAIV